MGRTLGRREFLARSGLVVGAALVPHSGAVFTANHETATDVPSILLEPTDANLQKYYQNALDLIASNVQKMAGYEKPVLIERSVYRGIWLECAPHEGLVYSAIRPDIGRNNHLGFFRQQREDGQLPCNLKVSDAGSGQIQMVVPICSNGTSGLLTPRRAPAFVFASIQP